MTNANKFNRFFLLGFASAAIAAAGCASADAPGTEDSAAQETIVEASEQLALAAPPVRDCRTTANCVAGQECVGIPADKSTKLGKCRQVAAPAGDGNDCSPIATCAAGLRCNGLSLAAQGTCRAAWMSANYTRNTAALASSVVVYGLATVPEDIVVKARMSARALGQVTLTLTDPNGAVATLCSPAQPCTAAQLANGIVVRDNSRDDQVNGRWTLRASAPTAVRIQSWTLLLSSRWD